MVVHAVLAALLGLIVVVLAASASDLSMLVIAVVILGWTAWAMRPRRAALIQARRGHASASRSSTGSSSS